MNRFLRIFSVLFIFAIIGFTAIYYTNYTFYSQINKTNNNFIPSSKHPYFVEEEDDNFLFQIKQKPFAIALLGVDSDELNKGRTDAIVIGIVDTTNTKVTLFSVPRDLRVEIPNKGLDKVNHAYLQGPETTVETLQNKLDIPIKYYATINLKGFKDLVDVIGGVEIDVEKEMTFHDRLSDQYVSFKPGIQTLNGTEVLNYARYRGDPEGDFARNRRQRQVLEAIISQTADFRNITKINELLDALDKNVMTNMPFSSIVKTAVGMRSMDGESIQQLTMEAYPTMIDGISYVEINDSNLKKTQEDLKRALQLIE